VDTIQKIEQKEFKENLFLKRLLELYSVPKTLYVEGVLPSFTEDERGFLSPRILTVVGSRAHSQYAKEVIDYFIGSLKGEDVIIISGLALGVDALAHRAALANGMTTIAIPGSGLSPDSLYPREHVRLAEEILSAGGALISELTPDARAAKWTFPSRNRLMAAMSDAVLVVEAREKSGTLITARQALELGKNIGVVPGSIFSDHLKGSHNLLQDGATPVTDSTHLFELLALKKRDDVMLEKTLPLLSGAEKKLYDLLSSPLSKSELLEKSGMSPSAFLTTLTSLEVEGLVRSSLHEVRKVM
jgi:DNA processing protein